MVRTEQDSVLAVDFAGMAFRTPVVAASGTYGYGRDYADKFITLEDLYEGHFDPFGAITLKSVTLEAKPGNPPDRTVETYGGLVNSIGLQNVGVRRLVNDYLPSLRTLETNVIVSIAGNTVDEYERVAEVLTGTSARYPDDFAAVEVNISCPNVKQGGLEFGATCQGATAVISAVSRQVTHKPVIAKLSPNVANIGEIAVAAVEAGASALSMINTVSALVIDHKTRRPVLGGVYGGLSGPAVKPIGLHRVSSAYRALKAAGLTAPIIGMGGITNGVDAAEYIIAGATAVAVGTAMFFNPRVCIGIAGDLARFVREEISHGAITRYTDLIGSLRIP